MLCRYMPGIHAELKEEAAANVDVAAELTLTILGGLGVDPQTVDGNFAAHVEGDRMLVLAPSRAGTGGGTTVV